jgi:fatty acid desaturase
VYCTILWVHVNAEACRCCLHRHEDAVASYTGTRSMGRGGDSRPLASGGSGSSAPAYLLRDDFDAASFRSDLLAAVEQVGEPTAEDAAHISRLLVVVNGASALGLCALIATVLLARPGTVAVLLGGAVAALLISTSRCMAWTIVGHHAMHGGFSTLAKSGVMRSGWRRGAFAVGLWRRCVDWLDWMLPEAWNLEHNKLHHYHLSENLDPDVVEANFDTLRQLPGPCWAKMLLISLWMLTWKYTYYSTNTLKQLRLSQRQSWIARHWPPSEDRTSPLVVFHFPANFIACFLRGDMGGAGFWLVFAMQWVWLVCPMVLSVVGPALALHVVGCTTCWPVAVASRGPQAAAHCALVIGVAAECLTNVHSFVIIACNHAGSDLWRFSAPCQPHGAEFLLRCSYAGVNFECGSELVDMLYGWLNYQIEHHMFPDMTPLQYRKLQPMVMKICRKHGVQYIQQNALWRTWKTCLIASGAESMGQCQTVLCPKLK